MVQNVVIKKGEHGALLFHDKSFLCQLYHRRSFDPTGAGDTFAGGLRLYYTKRKHLKI
jgi:sugar/nucleoside kinase (ribokinase family)